MTDARDNSIAGNLLVQIALAVDDLADLVNCTRIVKLPVMPAYAPVPREIAIPLALPAAVPEQPTLLGLNSMLLFSLVVST